MDILDAYFMDELIINSFNYALGHSNFVVKRSLNFIKRACVSNPIKSETLEYMLDVVERRLKDYDDAILEAEMESLFGNKDFISKKLWELGGTSVALEWSKFRDFLITRVRH